MFEIRLSRRANRYYQRVDSNTAKRLNECFEDMSQNPFNALHVRPIHGRRGLYRYRVGGLRVLFNVDGEARIVNIVAIGPRGDIYSSD